MLSFDFLPGLKSDINQYFKPSQNQVGSTIGQFFPSKTLNFRMDATPKAPEINALIPKSQPAQNEQQPLPEISMIPQANPIVEATQALPPQVDLASILSLFGMPLPAQQTSPADLQQLLFQYQQLKNLFPNLGI